MKRDNILKLRMSNAEIEQFKELWRYYQLSEWGDDSYTMSDVVRIALSRELSRVKSGDFPAKSFQLSTDYIL